MLNTDVKKQINTARDILVGKIPDPKGQIDQITNALIYKFMDDQDRLSQTLPGGKASFFVNKLEPYAWHKLFDSKLSNQDRANLYVEGIEKLSKAKNLPDLFRDIFKDAFLPFRDADTIAMFLNEINKFDYHHSEDLGNAFEYLLSIMGSQGDAGQFRTPRNIIEFIVDAVNPTKDEDILDPACGTAGFLVEAYKHITENKKLSPNEIQELAKHIHGVDIDPGMAKIARVNLYLHGFKTPLITEDDTLTNESLWDKKYDVILANPPFMTPKGGIKPHDKFSVQSKRAEVLFTDYIAEHLKLAGRAGIVVPEGIIFQSSNTYKQLRKMLIEDNYLWGVISLPAGVFNPYSGVKTSILLLDRKRASEDKEIMFYKIEDDGFGLGAQRRESKKNDIPEALEVIENWRDGNKVELKKVSYVDKERIAEDGNYNLSVDRYKDTVDYSDAKWPMIELGEFCEISNGNSAPQDKSSYEEGEHPFFRTSDVGSVHLSENLDKTRDYLNNNGVDSMKLFKKGTILFPKSGASTFLNHRVIMGVDGYVASHLATIYPSKEKALSRYVYNLLTAIDAKDLTADQAYPSLKTSQIKKIKIPLPPLEIQEQIVAEIDGYSSILSGAKQIVDSWKPKIKIDPEWDIVQLKDIAKDFQYGSSKKSVSEGEIVCLRMGNIQNGEIDWSDLKYAPEDEDIEKYLLKPNDVLFNRTNSAKHVGKTAIYRGVKKAVFAGYLIRINYLKDIILGDYLNYCLNTESAKAFCQKVKTDGINQSNINAKILSTFSIPLPPIEIQKQIVEKIEAERELVESTKKLIDIHKQKIKEVIDNIWSE